MNAELLQRLPVRPYKPYIRTPPFADTHTEPTKLVTESTVTDVVCSTTVTINYASVSPEARTIDCIMSVLYVCCPK